MFVVVVVVNLFVCYCCRIFGFVDAVDVVLGGCHGTALLVQVQFGTIAGRL